MGWRTKQQLLQLHNSDSDLVDNIIASKVSLGHFRPHPDAPEVTVSLGHEERQRTSDQMRVEERMEIEVGSEAHRSLLGANAMNNMMVNRMGAASSSEAALAVKGKGKGGESIIGHIDELNNSFANLKAVAAAKDAPATQLFAAVELARQRLELFEQDKKEGNRVAPKPKKKKDPEDFAELMVANYAAGKSSASNVQVTADRAVTWSKSIGGQVSGKDLVWKLSKLAASGRHPQNAERDLQAAVKKFSLRMKVKIEEIPVRLYNPSTETIYEAQLPVICPVSFATAIWHEGPDLFESIFLGREGRDGAERFWNNARKNASWFKKAAAFPESSFRGLLPIYLYGDDVDAYRNTDAGAVSAIGWGCDFSYKQEAMLQTLLLCVYAEYTACEYTHDDIMLYACEKFKQMADTRIKHPWHSAGFRFQLFSCRGDLKWINAINGKRVSYWLADVCAQRLQRGNATELDELISTCMWSYCAMLREFDVSGMVLTTEQASLLHKYGSLHLLIYAYLRKLSSQTVRKQFLRSSFCILPKHHFLQHALDESLETLINPGVYNLLAAESWVGTIGKISRRVHRLKVSQRTIERYLCMLRLHVNRLKMRLRQV
ncbi:unnamed protein product [Symbiodinium microadriaticum]|nr:unnamed protein product [Symbiodinium microadriaticum]